MSRETGLVGAEKSSRIATVAARRDGLAFGGGGPGLRLAEGWRRLLDGANEDLANGAGPVLLAAVFAAGISLYFSLPSEPWTPALAAAMLVALAVAWGRRRGGARAIGATVTATLLAGATIAAVGTRLAAAPRLDRERTVSVEGRVNDLDATAKGGTRLGVAVTRMEGTRLAPEDVPSMVTATLARGRAAPAMGEAIAFKARLKPPDGPVLPDGYDFARRAWFDGRGAGGYVLGRARPVDLGPRPLFDRLMAPIGDLRHAVADRVRARLPGGTGAIGAALIVGEQRAIPDAVNDPLRASGLTHIVSISGLHMSLVAGGVMVVLRFLFVAIPGFAMHRSAKKAAAVVALIATTIYLLLSGLQVAAVRSHLMLSVALLAVLVDRPAITLHTVAVAAMAILVVDPEAAMEPSFRMSFLAVIALVASWDLWRLRVEARPPPSREAHPAVQLLGAAWRHVEGLAFSSLIAGLATAPVIVGVFYRGAPYSILANMIVLPVVGVVVMPAAVVAALAMPFGLDGLPLDVMGLGIDFMVEVGRRVSALPGGAGLIGAPHPLAMPFGIAAVLWLSLWHSRIRLLGLVPGVLSIALAAFGPHPDVLVGRHGSPVAVRGDDGRLHVLAGRDDRFDVAIWLAADADDRSPDDRGLAEGWRCDALGCAFRREGYGGSGRAALDVAVVRDPRGFPEECARADLVISRLVAPPGCAEATTVVDRARQATTGAIALTATQARPAESGTSPRPAPPAVRPPVDPTAIDEEIGEPTAPDPALRPNETDRRRVPAGRRLDVAAVAPSATAGAAAVRPDPAERSAAAPRSVDGAPTGDGSVPSGPPAFAAASSGAAGPSVAIEPNIDATPSAPTGGVPATAIGGAPSATIPGASSDVIRGASSATVERTIDAAPAAPTGGVPAAAIGGAPSATIPGASSAVSRGASSATIEPSIDAAPAAPTEGAPATAIRGARSASLGGASTAVLIGGKSSAVVGGAGTANSPTGRTAAAPSAVGSSAVAPDASAAPDASSSAGSAVGSSGVPSPVVPAVGSLAVSSAPSSTAGSRPGIGEASPAPPLRPSVRFAATASLPAGGRPWTPRDPAVPRLLEEVTPIVAGAADADAGDGEPSLNSDGSDPPADPEP